MTNSIIAFVQDNTKTMLEKLLKDYEVEFSYLKDDVSGCIKNHSMVIWEYDEVAPEEKLKLIKKETKIPIIAIVYDSDRSTIFSDRYEWIDGVHIITSAPALLKRLVIHHLEFYNYQNDLEGIIRKKEKEIMEQTDVMLHTIVTLIGTHDEETEGHVERTSLYVRALANGLSARGHYTEVLTHENIEKMAKVAPLHDVGKIGISGEILRDKNPKGLSDENFKEVKKHAAIGADAIKKALSSMKKPNYYEYAEEMARHHHENWDGTGYPDNLVGENIPIASRIMAIADSYDTIVSERPYKKGKSHSVAIDDITKKCRGNKYDPVMCDVLKIIHREFEEIKNSKK